MASFPGALDAKGTTEVLAHVKTLLPDEWLAAAATGTPEQCVTTVRRQFDLGADSVILHGATPAELAPVVEAYRATDSEAAYFGTLSANPGRMTEPTMSKPDERARRPVKFANVGGRAALTTGEVWNSNDDPYRMFLVCFDLERLSRERFGSDPQALFDEWPDVAEFARSIEADLDEWDHDADPDPVVFVDELSELGPPVPRPRQVFGIGLNYRDHAAETGAATPRSRRRSPSSRPPSPAREPPSSFRPTRSTGRSSSSS